MNEHTNASPTTTAGQKWPRLWFAIFPMSVSLLVLVVLGVFVVQELKDQQDKKKYAVNNSSSTDEEKHLAEMMEIKGLHVMAAQSYIRYLSRSQLQRMEKAQYYYRIGTLFHKGKRYDRALEYYFRSDMTKSLPEIRIELSQKIKECFEKLGIDPKTGEKIVKEENPSATLR